MVPWKTVLMFHASKWRALLCKSTGRRAARASIAKHASYWNKRSSFPSFSSLRLEHLGIVPGLLARRRNVQIPVWSSSQKPRKGGWIYLVWKPEPTRTDPCSTNPYKWGKMVTALKPAFSQCFQNLFYSAKQDLNILLASVHNSGFVLKIKKTKRKICFSKLAVVVGDSIYLYVSFKNTFGLAELVSYD